MACEKLNNFADLLSSYSLIILSDKDSETLCGICHRVMINATITSCGCSYCESCIKDFTRGGNEYCPGINTDCKLEFLNYDKDVHTDVRVNHKIGKLLAKCPHESCDISVEVAQMKYHIEMCDKYATSCPYNDLGCNQGNMPLGALNRHLNNERLEHANTIIGVVEDLRRETSALKAVIEEQKYKIEKLENMLITTQVEKKNEDEGNAFIRKMVGEIKEFLDPISKENIPQEYQKEFNTNIDITAVRALYYKVKENHSNMKKIKEKLSCEDKIRFKDSTTILRAIGYTLLENRNLDEEECRELADKLYLTNEIYKIACYNLYVLK